MKIKAAFSECPTVCSKNGDLLVPSYDVRRFNLCEVCPHKKGKDHFRQLFDTMIEQRFGQTSGKNYRFDDLLNLLYDVRDMESVDRAGLSVKSSALLGVYLQEKNHFEREQDEKKAKKN